MRGLGLARCVALGLLVLAACRPLGPGTLDAPTAAPARATSTAEVSVVIAPITRTPTTAPAALRIATLGAGQHISAGGSYTATETLAAGPMHCRIEHGSPAFQRLARYPAGAVLFSGGEPPPYDQEDELMHPAAVLPLSRLEVLAREEWGSAAQSDQSVVMVTEAYDSRRSHDIAQADTGLKYSLHFEGRSLDVIPWPPAPERLARLCALAHAAGFDWVHNEGDHCHVSVKAESLCLPGGETSP